MANAAAPATLPIVLWHGLESWSTDPATVGFLADTIKKYSPNTFVHSIVFDENFVDDEEWSSVVGKANHQVGAVCTKLSNMPQLKNGFHAIGYDQGGLMLRALVQECAGIKVHSLVTLGSSHRGITSLPICRSGAPWCPYIHDLLDAGVYTAAAQDEVMVAQWFHDPNREATYLSANQFLVPLNNQVVLNKQYKTRLEALDNLVLVAWPNDRTTYVPTESQQFGYLGQPMKQTKLYQNDLIGLKTLDQNGKLHLIDATSNSFGTMTEQFFVQEIGSPYFHLPLKPPAAPTNVPAPTAGVPTNAPPHPVPTPHHTMPTHTPVPTHGGAPTNVPPHTAPTAAPPTAKPTPVPMGCPETADDWSKETAKQFMSLKPQCFADLTDAKVAKFSDKVCGVLTEAQLKVLVKGCAGFSKACVGALGVNTVSALSPVCAAALTGDAVSGFMEVQAHSLTPAVLGAIDDKAMPSISPKVIAKLDLTQFKAFAAKQVAALDEAQFAALPAAVCAGMPVKQTSMLETQCAFFTNKCVDAVPSWAGFGMECAHSLNASAVTGADWNKLATVSPDGWSGFSADEFTALFGKNRANMLKLSYTALAKVPGDVIQSVSNDLAAKKMADFDLCGAKPHFVEDASWLGIASVSSNSSSCFTGTEIAQLKPLNVAALRGDQFEKIEPKVFARFSPEQIANLQDNAVSKITVDEFGKLTPSQFTALCSHLGSLSDAVAQKVTTKQLTALTKKDACKDEAQECIFLEKVPSKVRDDAETNDAAVETLLKKCNLHGWDSIDYIVLVVCILICLVSFIVCVVMAMRNSRSRDRQLGHYEQLLADDDI